MKKFFNKLSLMISMCVISAVAFGVAFTAAAFLNIELHTQTISVDAGYGKYFDSDPNSVDIPGTQNNPYLIKTPDQLRNLSKLTNMGLFNESHYFKLAPANNTMVWSGEALTPIGTMSNPFNSHFDGTINASDPKNVVKIQNLQVVGSDLANVGMFGYVGNKGEIKGFLLDSPVVTSKGSQGFSYALIDKNPLRTVFTESVVENIKITNPVLKGTTDEEGVTGFSVDASNLETLKAYTIDGINMEYDISISSTRDDLCTISAPSGGVYSVTFPDINKETAKKDGDYFIIEVLASGLVKDSTTGFNRYASLILERFKCYYDYNISAVVKDITNAKHYRSMINNNVQIEKISSDESEVYINSQGVYIGVVCGCLDGSAERIGVYRPTLTSETRPFITNSILIGKRIDDDEHSTLSKENLNVQLASEEPKDPSNPSTSGLSYKYVSPNLINYSINGKSVPNTDRGIGNRLVDGIYGKNKGFTKAAENIIRFYGTNKGNDNGDANTLPSGKVNGTQLETVKVYANEDNEYIKQDEFDASLTDQTVEGHYLEKELACISYTDLMSAYLTNEVYSSAFYASRYDKMFASNAILLWISAVDDSGIIQKLFGRGTQFYLTIELDYVFFDDDPSIHATSANDIFSKRELDMYACRKSIEQFTFGGLYRKNAYYEYTETNGSDGTNYIRGDSPLDHVRTENEGTNLQFQYGAIQNPVNTKSDTIRDDVMRFDQGEVADYASVDKREKDKAYQVLTRKIRVVPKSDSYKWGSKSAYHCFVLGMNNKVGANPAPTLPFKLCILGARVMLSDIHGNFSDTLGTVDFTASATALPYTNGGEWNPSNVKVNAKTLKNFYIAPSGDPATITPEKISIHPEGTNVSSYTLKVSRTDTFGRNVRVQYIINGGPSQPDYILPKSQEGYNAVNIGTGAAW